MTSTESNPFDQGRASQPAYRLSVAVVVLCIAAITTGVPAGGGLQAALGVPNLIADVNEQDLAFTVHDGDLDVDKPSLDSQGRRLENFTPVETFGLLCSRPRDQRAH